MFTAKTPSLFLLPKRIFFLFRTHVALLNTHFFLSFIFLLTFFILFIVSSPSCSTDLSLWKASASSPRHSLHSWLFFDAHTMPFACCWHFSPPVFFFNNDFLPAVLYFFFLFIFSLSLLKKVLHHTAPLLVTLSCVVSFRFNVGARVVFLLCCLWLLFFSPFLYVFFFILWEGKLMYVHCVIFLMNMKWKTQSSVSVSPFILFSHSAHKGRCIFNRKIRIIFVLRTIVR